MELLVHGPRFECHWHRRPRMTGPLRASSFFSLETCLKCNVAASGLLVPPVQHAAFHLRADSTPPPDSFSVQDSPETSLCYCAGAPDCMSSLHTTLPMKFITLVISCPKSNFCMRLQVHESRKHVYVIYCLVTVYDLDKMLRT